MIFSFKVPIYGFIVKFLIDPTDKELKKCKLERLDKKLYLATTYEHKYVVFWNKKEKIKNGIVNHELYHLTRRLMDNIGVIQSGDSEEAYAYLLDYLTDKFYEKFDKL